MSRIQVSFPSRRGGGGGCLGMGHASIPASVYTGRCLAALALCVWGCCGVSVLVQGPGQEVVEACDHGPGVVIEPGRDHGVVVDLRDVGGTQGEQVKWKACRGAERGSPRGSEEGVSTCSRSSPASSESLSFSACIFLMRTCLQPGEEPVRTCYGHWVRARHLVQIRHYSFDCIPSYKIYLRKIWTTNQPGDKGTLNVRFVFNFPQRRLK